MNKRTWLTYGLSLGVVALLVGGAQAQDKKDEKKGAEPAPKKEAPPSGDKKPGGDAKKDAKSGMPEMSAEEAAMMEAWMKAGTVGPNHDALKPLAGSWTYTMRMRFTPNSSWGDSSGTIERKWILDGHYLQEDVSGTMGPGGPPFKGIGMLGYDNTLKKYIVTWMDSLSTAIASFEGSYDAAKKTFMYNGECADPVTGKPKKSRSVLTIKDDKTHTMQMFEPDKDGKEFLSFEMTCTKK